MVIQYEERKKNMFQLNRYNKYKFIAINAIKTKKKNLNQKQNIIEKNIKENEIFNSNI